MSKRTRITSLWTTKGPTGLVHWSGVGLHLTKREALAKLSRRARTAWPKLRRLGYRAITVTLLEESA